jgi:hypothetical protein
MHGDSLNKYCRASHELREALQNDFYLDAIDRMTLENLYGGDGNDLQDVYASES